MVNINIEIPDGLHRQLKIKAATQGVTLKELVNITLDEALHHEAQKK